MEDLIKSDALKRLSYIEGHLRNCVPKGIAEGATEQIVSELMALYELKPAFDLTEEVKGER